MFSIVGLIKGIVDAFNAVMRKFQQSHDEENGANRVQVAAQTEVLQDVAVAKHVDNDVRLDGPLANWVRERNKAGG